MKGRGGGGGGEGGRGKGGGAGKREGGRDAMRWQTGSRVVQRSTSLGYEEKL